MNKLIQILSLLIILLNYKQVLAHNDNIPLVDFIENKGQWDNHILFEASIPNGKLFLEKDGIMFVLYSPEDISRQHDIHHGHIKNPTDDDYLVDCHAYKMYFENGLPTVQTSGNNQKHDYVNYFIGNDKSKWASHVNKFSEVIYKNVYQGIDFKIYSEGTDIKYDFIVHPKADVSDISYFFEGIDKINLLSGNLFLHTSINHIVDKEPYSYQHEGKKIATHYVLDENNHISFDVASYDKSTALIIDPLLIFGSYSGSTSDNWGYTATYDELGHLYAGGVSFGSGYPTTTGAFQTSFLGGSSNNWNNGTDISIMKYAPDGTSLIYSTYVGGSNSNECPHSLVVDENNNLCIYGSTSSNDFPTSTNCYDSTFNGGTAFASSGINYKYGADIIIVKLNEGGTDLVAGTYVGGSANDGLNVGTLKYNYADDYRGEIIVDKNGNCYVASTTFSDDFPVSTNAAQSIYGGSQDGCVFKLNGDLSQLQWSTYIGGASNDAVYSMQFNVDEEVYITGGTKSSDFPTTSGVLTPAFQGVTDGFISKINNDGSTFLYSTYVGTTAHDQTYFVQLDSVDNVYVVGQTKGAYPVFPNTVYKNANSGQFIHKFTPELNSTIFSTVVGAQRNDVDIALSAFLVNSCAQIYISGWGGEVNVSNNGPQLSSTSGMPITSDAYQNSTDGSDFYLMVLSQDAASLEYATFFGGSTSAEHVDGGTSRFDKDGVVYQAVCGGCGGNSDFPTTQNAWSQTNNSSNCNIASFKFDLSSMTASASIASPLLCAPANAVFQNKSNGGVQFLWDFGDGTTSTAFAPTHTYNDTGTYVITLISYDPALCIAADTSEIEIRVDVTPAISVTEYVEGCYHQNAQLNAWGASEYSWQPTLGLDDNTSASPIAYVNAELTYTVTGYNQCGSSTKQVTLSPIMDNTSISPDTTICIGDYLPVEAYGGIIYEWEGNNITNTSSAQAVVHPDVSSTYNVSITDNKGCTWLRNIFIEVDTALPSFTLGNDTLICFGDDITLSATGGGYYNWSSNIDTSMTTDSIINITPNKTNSYSITVTNGCGYSIDDVEITISTGPDLLVTPDLYSCPGDSVQLTSSGAPNVSWYPANDVDAPNSYTPKTLADEDKYFIVYGSDNCGTKQDTVNLYLYIDETYQSNDTAICLGQTAILSGYNGTYYEWDPKSMVDNPFNQTTTTTPNKSTSYTLNILDHYGCTWKKTINVIVDTVLPVAKVSDDTTICYGDTVQLKAWGGFYYHWQTETWVDNFNKATINTSPEISSNYMVTVTNGCGSDYNSVNIEVRKIESNTTPYIAVCIGDSVQLNASGGNTYLWYPPQPLDDFSSPTPKLLVEYPQLFKVTIINDLLCEITDSVYVDTLPKAYVDAGEETIVEFGSYEPLYPTGEGASFIWSPAEYTDCDTCFNPNVSPKATTYFYITLTDENGCKASDSVLVYVTGSIYVANTFTPNKDHINDIFYAFGEEIEDFTMYIFNRWGDMIYQSNSIHIGWDGTHKGKICPTGTYIWKIEYRETNGYSGTMVGHVNLLR